MPNRIIKESICTSDTLTQLSAEEERLFYRLMVQADDFGRFDGRPDVVMARCFSAMLSQVTVDQVASWLAGLERAGLITTYEVEGKPYLCFRTWELHQVRRAKKSKYPPPPEDEIICNQVQADESKRMQTQTNDAPNVFEFEFENEIENGNGIDNGARDEAMRLLTTRLATWHGLRHIRDSLADFADEMGWPVVVQAMNKTLEAGTTNWKYCRRILNDWSEQGVRSPDDVSKLEARFEASKRRRAPPEPETTASRLYPVLLPGDEEAVS